MTTPIDENDVVGRFRGHQHRSSVGRARRRARRPPVRRSAPAAPSIPCRAPSPALCGGRSRRAGGRSTRRCGARLRTAPRAAPDRGGARRGDRIDRRRPCDRRLGGGVEHRVRVVDVGDARQARRTLRRAEARAGVVVDHAVTTEITQVRADRGGLAGDRRARKAARVEVSEVAAQHATIDVGRARGRRVMHHSTNSSTSCAYASRVCGLAPVSDDANASRSARSPACSRAHPFGPAQPPLAARAR